MAVTSIPTLTKTMDNAFTQTWFEVRPDAIDNIILATPIWSALKAKGCFKTQVGGTNIERTVRYALPTTQNITKGSVMSNAEVETRTAGFWTWRYVAANIVRSLIDDQRNQGKFRIVSYVSERLSEAKDSLGQNYETKILQTEVTDESGLDIQGLNDMVPAIANAATGTYGGINRPTAFTGVNPTSGNIWWSPKYYQMNLPYEVNLVTDMKHIYNVIWNNQEAPNLLVADQGLYELYEESALDAVQIVKNSTMSADLGFNNIMFKGADMVWSPNVTTNNILFLNTNYIDVVYDPTVWFEMTDWKDTPNQLERAAQIVCCMNSLSPQLRRHGRLYA